MSNAIISILIASLRIIGTFPSFTVFPDEPDSNWLLSPWFSLPFHAFDRRISFGIQASIWFRRLIFWRVLRFWLCLLGISRRAWRCSSMIFIFGVCCHLAPDLSILTCCYLFWLDYCSFVAHEVRFRAISRWMPNSWALTLLIALNKQGSVSTAKEICRLKTNAANSAIPVTRHVLLKDFPHFDLSYFSNSIPH